MATFEDYLFTKNTKWVLWALGAFLLACLIFLAGLAVGENHIRRERGDLFVSGSTLPGGLPLPNGFTTAGGHGALGTITALTLPTLQLEERDGDTVLVRVATGTPIGGAPVLEKGQFIVVIGDPTTTPQGQESVDARFVRVLPPPQNATGTMNGVIEYKVF